MKSRTKLFCRVAAVTCSALILASAVAGVSFSGNNITLDKSVSAAAGYPVDAQSTESWSGYVAENHKFNTVQAEITVPTVTCTTQNSNLLVWVGFDGFNEKIAQPTTEQVGVGADCGKVGSKPNYYTWWEMYPTNNMVKIDKSVVDIKAGDKIWTTVTYNGSPNYYYTLRVRNVRTNQAKNINIGCGKYQNKQLVCRRGTAEFIAERKLVSSGYTALAKWSSDPYMFTNAKAAFGTSRTLKPLDYFTPTPLNMLSYKTGNTLAKVTSIASNGTTFTSTYKNSK